MSPDGIKRCKGLIAISNLISNILQVFDEGITAEWRNKIFRLGQYMTPKTMDWIIKELQ